MASALPREEPELLDDNVLTETAAFHNHRIMQDFSLANNSELLRFAIRQRVIEQH